MSESTKHASKLNSLRWRILSTSLLWGVVVLGIISGSKIFWLTVVGLLSLLGVHEYLRMLGQSLPPYFRWAAVLGCGAYLLAWYLFLGNGGTSELSSIDAIFVIGLVLGSFLLQLNRPIEQRQTLENVTNIVFASLYAVFLFNFLIRILYLPGEQAQGQINATNGHFYALFLLAITKGTDMGAFIVGSLMGKNKMAPYISPKKTWEGFAGAMLFSFIAAIAVYVPLQEKLTLLNWTHVLVLAPVLGVAAVLGDLAESVVKRSLLAKDSGSTIPGIGGVLDLIDSICFTAPILYLYLSFL